MSDNRDDLFGEYAARQRPTAASRDEVPAAAANEQNAVVKPATASLAQANVALREVGQYGTGKPRRIIVRGKVAADTDDEAARE